MPKLPTCANCGRSMIETPRSMRRDGEWDFSVFECSMCGIDFFTEDHVPLTGLPGLRDKKRALVPTAEALRFHAALNAGSSTRH